MAACTSFSSPEKRRPTLFFKDISWTSCPDWKSHIPMRQRGSILAAMVYKQLALIRATPSFQTLTTSGRSPSLSATKSLFTQVSRQFSSRQISSTALRGEVFLALCVEVVYIAAVKKSCCLVDPFYQLFLSEGRLIHSINCF
ncbi:hypothetical protein O6H91_06G087800 [Diphasiastrum complanatum]|uniref:Uncharacterized protein n=1 Tax=Diphasiastrum complanatum TaxID=34168 RepID=A0ACC2DG41_DIPCM|nr:hypothetical protein O6H91_06G087800 [Diphasiastrum complanatum]